ncbi:MAG: hypothetical protein JWP22_981 [Ramlibacter sp.]|jgi:hypothetical protein|nr:hypothetical protein [Ramlibacter sp.]MDB5912306.1 hypothetical protein [Ramlibacter sp.]
MKVAYVSQAGNGPTYEIEADRHGNYSIRCSGRVVKRVTSVTNYIGKPRWGSRELQLNAIEEAKAAIDAHHSAEH